MLYSVATKTAFDIGLSNKNKHTHYIIFIALPIAELLGFASLDRTLL